MASPETRALVALVALWSGPVAAQPVALTVQYGHNGMVAGVDLTPDGRLLVSCGQDNAVKVWDTRTGKLLRTLLGHKFQTNTVRFDAGGESVLSASHDGWLRRWDVATGEVLGQKQGHCTAGGQCHPVLALDSSADGTVGITGGTDGQLVVWDLGVLEPRLSLAGHEDYVPSVAISADGQLAASGDSHGNVKLWDVRRGKEIRGFRAHEPMNGMPQAPIESLDLSPDGRLLVTAASADPARAARLWDTKTGKKVAELTRKHYSSLSPPRFVGFTADGKEILLGTLDAVSVWDVATRRLGREYTGFGTMPLTVAMTPDGSLLATGYSRMGASLRLYDGKSTELLHELGEPGSLYSTVVFSPDGSEVVSFDRDRKEVRRWETASLRPLRTVKVDAPAMLDGALAPDGRSFIIANIQELVRWDAATGRELERWKGASITTWSLAWSKDGRWLLTGTPDGTVSLWDARKKQKLKDLPGKFDTAMGVDVSADGRWALGHGSRGGDFRVWSLPKGKLLRHVVAYDRSEHDAIFSAAFSPDGRRVLTAGNHIDMGPPIKLWDARSGKLVREYNRLHLSARVAVFSPDAKQIVASDNERIHLFDTASGESLRTLTGHNAVVSTLDVSPDGRYLVSSGYDGVVNLWRLEDGGYGSLIGRGDEWVVYGPSGHFDASRNGGSLVAMVRGLDAYSIDQLALSHNRPDLLLQSLGLGDPGLIEHYRSRWRRRLRKAGLTEAQASGSAELHVPTATILGTKRAGRDVDVRYRCSEEHRTLLSHDVFVNGVPHHGGIGEPFTGQRREATGETRVRLTPGDNQIEVRCTNSAGAEALSPVARERLDDRAPGALWFLGFGVSRYANPDLDLQFAHQDVADLAGLLTKAANAAAYRQVHVHTFADEQATVEAVRSASSLLAEAAVDDTLVLFVAGHGMHDDTTQASYYYLTHEADPANLAETAAPFELLEELLARAKPRRKLFLLDTCESGEVDPEEAGSQVAALSGSRGIKARSTRGVARPPGKASGEKAPRRKHLLQRDRFIYNDLARRSGAVVLSSSRGGELSYESPAWQNGLFTEEILRALSTPGLADRNGDGAVDNRELREYVAGAVSRQSGGAQNPVVDRDNIYQLIRLPVVAP